MAEHSTFTCSNGLGTAILAVYVDNVTVMVSSPLAMTGTKATLQKYFDIIELRPVKWLLGVCNECDQPNHTISLSQTVYITSVVPGSNWKMVSK